MNIKEYYSGLAEIWGDSAQCSMEDTYTRDKEVSEIIKAITYHTGKGKESVLEIGCGNGYTAERVSNTLNIRMAAVDFCKDLVTIAKQRLCNVVFQEMDVTNLIFRNELYDIVYTERCLINLPDWETQKRALDEIYRVLKPGGVYIMLEAFTDGLDNLNGARNAVGLPNISQPEHNVFFVPELVNGYARNKFDILVRDSFLSSYYFGSRVLYPALSKKIEYNNKFNEFFSEMCPVGNFSYIQMYVLRKL